MHTKTKFGMYDKPDDKQKQDTLFLMRIGNILKSKHVNVNTTLYVAIMMYNIMLRRGKRLSERRERWRLSSTENRGD